MHVVERKQNSKDPGNNMSVAFEPPRARCNMEQESKRLIS